MVFLHVIACRVEALGIEFVKAQALTVCEGLPKCTSTVRALAEDHTTKHGVRRMQETFHVHLQQR